MNRKFSLLLINHTAGHLGDILYIAVVVLYIYKSTGSVLASALFPFVRVIALFFSSFVSPLLIERMPLQRMMALTRLGETLAMVLLAVFLLSGGTSVALILTIVFAVSFIHGWADPVTYSLVPRLVEQNNLSRANGVLGTAREITGVIGWLAGGVGALAFGIPVMLCGSAVLFGVGVVAMHVLRKADVQAEEAVSGSSNVGGGDGKPGKWAAIRLGWVELLNNRTARFITIMDVIEGCGYSIYLGSFTILFVETQLKRGPEWWGYINAAYFIGMIAGGVLVTAAARRLNGRLPSALALGSLGYGAATLVYAFTHSAMAALLLVLVMGIPMMVRDTAQRTLFQLNVPHDKLPNTLVAHGALNSAVFAVSIVLIGWMAERFGPSAIYVFGGALSCFSALVGIVMFVRLRGGVRLPSSEAIDQGE